MRRYKVLVPPPKPTKIEPIPLTEAFHQQLKQKLQQLSQLETELKERLKTAREMGDLSENGMYKAAKFELGNVGRQLGQITFLLRYGYVPTKTSNHTTIVFGSQVKLLQDATKEIDYLIVSEYEADPSNGKISLKSPLGKLLHGKQAGESVSLVLPKQTVQYQILMVS